MARRPFDPSRAAGPAPDPAAPARREGKIPLAEARPLTVSELSNIIRTTLEERIAAPIYVVGEVSNLSTRNHWYFSLKDDGAVLPCVAWASSVREFGFTPRDGDAVVAVGHVSHYGQFGKTQLYVRKLKPIGAGGLNERFEAMCRELRELGYFAPERKQPLPLLPRRIAVITSAGGAAIHDVVDTARRRWAGVDLLVVDVRVQGDGAAASVARAIERVDAARATLGVDAILVTRGGGSMEDLWAFNERVVADAAYACSLPLVAAIGHESDTTVIELVADERAATPTQAAVRLVPDAVDLRRQTDHNAQRMQSLLRQRVRASRQRVETLAAREFFRRPAAVVERARARQIERERALDRALRGRVALARSRVESLAARLAACRPHALFAERRTRVAVLAERLDGAVRHRLRGARQHCDGLAAQLDAVDPRRVLARGFSWTTRADDGRLVRRAADVKPGETIVTELAEGTVRSVVDGEGPAEPGLFG